MELKATFETVSVGGCNSWTPAIRLRIFCKGFCLFIRRSSNWCPSHLSSQRPSSTEVSPKKRASLGHGCPAQPQRTKTPSHPIQFYPCLWSQHQSGASEVPRLLASSQQANSAKSSHLSTGSKAAPISSRLREAFHSHSHSLSVCTALP